MIMLALISWILCKLSAPAWCFVLVGVIAFERILELLYKMLKSKNEL